MARPSWRAIFGVAGVDLSESRLAQNTAVVTQIIMALIVVWLLVSPYFHRTYHFSAETSAIIDWVIWGFFLTETVLLTSIVKRRWFYFWSNWLNVAIIILVFPLIWERANYFGILRIVRIIVIFYMLVPLNLFLKREFTVKNLMAVIGMFFSLTLLAGILLSYFDPSFNNPWEGIWWAFQTVTTVGYGDAVPASIGGQAFAILFMFVGVALLAILSASLAYFLLRRKAQSIEAQQRKDLHQKVDEMHAAIQKLTKELSQNKKD